METEGGTEVAAVDFPYPVVLVILQIGGAGGEDVAQEVALGDAAPVLALQVEDGDGGMAPVVDDLQSLATDGDLLEAGGAVFRGHDFGNIHGVLRWYGMGTSEDSLP